MNLVKTFLTWLVILGFLAFAGWQTYLFIAKSSQPRVTVTVQGDTYKVGVVVSEADREKGLSGTKSLAKDEGLLFVFPRNDTWGIWMKDMEIPIDIMWLNEEKKVIYIVKHAEPSSYPYTTFKPTSPAKYVLELPADTIEARGYKIGTKAEFDLPDTEEGTQ